MKEEEPESVEYGYVRVSGKSQNEERQLYAMEKAGIARERLYIDKQSGKDFNRPEYQRLLRKLREGDALFVQSIDRLGRNYEEILEHWGLLTRKKKVDIVVLDFPLLDTRGRGEDPEPHREIPGRHGAADTGLCGTERAGKHTSETGGGHRRSEGQREALGEKKEKLTS